MTRLNHKKRLRNPTFLAVAWLCLVLSAGCGKVENKRSSSDTPAEVRHFLKSFVLVEGGEFEMGSTRGGSDEAPVHRVLLDNYWISASEVSNCVYETILPKRERGKGSKGRFQPATNVSWFDAASFCRRLTIRERQRGTLPINEEYRLPTEAEWEFAAKGTQNLKYSWGESETPTVEEAWIGRSAEQEARPVDRGKPNFRGLCNMSGNVWEWCLDWYSVDYYQSCLDNKIVANPRGPSAGDRKVLRGGCWFVNKSFATTTFRGWRIPGFPQRAIGFRVVRAKADRDTTRNGTSEGVIEK